MYISTFWSPFFSILQQLGGDPPHWTQVYAILKGTSLCCYRRQEDVEASIEPAFTIAINKVCTASNENSGGGNPTAEVDPIFPD